MSWKMYDVYIHLQTRVYAEDPGEALDEALDLIAEGDGMEIIKHETIEVEE